MKYLILFLSFFICKYSYSSEYDNWKYEYTLLVKEFKSENLTKEEVLKNTKYPLYKKINFCLIDKEKIEENIKKDFPSCDISYIKNNISVDLEVECGDSSIFSMKIKQLARNEYIGDISYKENNKDYFLQAEGKLNIIQNGYCSNK